MLQDVHHSHLLFCPCLRLHLNGFDVCKQGIKIGAHDESPLHAAEDIQSPLLFVQYDRLLKKGRLSSRRHLLGRMLTPVLKPF